MPKSRAISILRAIVFDKHKMYEPALQSYERFLASSEGKYPDEEFKARQRVRIIKKELSQEVGECTDLCYWRSLTVPDVCRDSR